MTKFTAKAVIYLVLSVIGLMFSIYAVRTKNLILLIASILFALVSADNIFCNLKGKN